MSLNAFLREERAREDFGLTSVWVGVGVPEGVDLKTRLFVRALQAAALQKLGKNSDEILAELDALLAGSRRQGSAGEIWRLRHDSDPLFPSPARPRSTVCGESGDERECYEANSTQG